jgi:hypothetical protein
VSTTIADPAAVVADLRRARRKQRVAAIHWVDALYQVYITGLLAVVAVVLVSGLVGDEEVTGSALADVTTHGPALLGTLAALAVFGGLRSGSRGGPLALEQPDVRHVLLSPIDRAVALRGPAWRQLRFLGFAGAAVGATAGQLALRRLPGNAAEWLAFGALFVVVLAALQFGSALLASGTGLPRWAATGIGAALLAWSVADVANVSEVGGSAFSAPGTLAGRLGLWPLDADPLALLAVAVPAGLVAVGLVLVGGTSLEAAERRTALVGQLRFAVTLQDLRTVLVLRRQLAQERPRAAPWIGALDRSPRYPVWHRGLRSLARWPATRILRVVIFAALAGAALRGVWAGTTPLLVAVGLALWIAALDAVEPLGQDIDHPGRTDGFPFDRGELHLKHLPIVGLVSVVAGLVAGGVAGAPIGDPLSMPVALLVGAVAGLLAGCGAVVSVIQGAPDAVDVLSIATPEIAGARTVLRTALPPGLAILGTLPVLAARAAELGASDPPPVAAALTAVFPLLSVGVLFGAWVRFRDDLRVWMRDAMEQASPMKAAERAAAEREAAEDDVAEDDTADAPDDPDGDDDGEQPSRATPKPRPRPKAKPKPPPPGTRGGTSPKPIGRRRDQQ